MYIYAIIYRRYYRYIRCYVYSASISICAILYIKALLYICTAKKPIYFMPRYYPKPTGYVHVAVCSIRCY
jgi:hypothetical protein